MDRLVHKLNLPISFEDIDNEIEWHQMTLQGGNVPRLYQLQLETTTINQHTCIPIYRHPTDSEDLIYTKFTPNVLKVKQEIEALYNVKLNHCLIQKYRDGKDFISRHSDKTIDIKDGTTIFGYSLGGTRKLELRHKLTKNISYCDLSHNSLFLLDWKTNQDYSHAIKKQLNAKARISLTFRTIDTYKSITNGHLYGKGADLTRDEVFAHFHFANK
eukprot:NODE_329_length_9526_cov_0.701708.p5 type:complete len:215 gc:universal NODE_329_length_9526_cov_0.701708:8893-8249(-)